MSARVSICRLLILRPQREEFLNNLVTGDESWLLYKNDKRTAVWIPREEEPPTQPKPNPHGKKVLLCVWWDALGGLYHEYIKEGDTVTAIVYSRQLRQLASTIREKRKRRVDV